MERIGLAASKMARGNIFLYNFYVVLVSILFSLFIFFISGASILLGLFIMGYLIQGLLPYGREDQWLAVIRVCMISLTVVTSIITLFAILKNVKWHRNR